MSEPQYNKITVVNEVDEVVGAMSIEEAIQQRLIRRVARILVYNDEGKLLLQKRGKHVMKPNLYDHSASGHVDAGESYAAAAARELCEELGICDVPLEEVFTPYRCYESETSDFFVSLYKITVPADYPIVFPRDEVEGVYWYTEEEMATEIKNNPQLFTSALILDWEKNRSIFFQ